MNRHASNGSLGRRNPRSSPAGLAVVGLVVAMGCGGKETGGAGGGKSGCTPGEQIACPCARSDEMGVQECADDGSGFGNCIGCAGGSSGSGEGGFGSGSGSGSGSGGCSSSGCFDAGGPCNSAGDGSECCSCLCLDDNSCA
jgi:hypothetical protein